MSEEYFYFLRLLGISIYSSIHTYRVLMIKAPLDLVLESYYIDSHSAVLRKSYYTIRCPNPSKKPKGLCTYLVYPMLKLGSYKVSQKEVQWSR